MDINTITCDRIASEMYVGVASRTRGLGMTDAPRFAWADATPAAGRNLVTGTHANSKQDRPPREDLR